MEMRRDSRYIHLGQERKHLLFPLKFQPPLLIYPLLSVNEGLDEYGRVVGDIIWKMYNDNKGYYWNSDEGEATESVHVDFHVKTRVKNYMLDGGPTRA